MAGASGKGGNNPTDVSGAAPAVAAAATNPEAGSSMVDASADTVHSLEEHDPGTAQTVATPLSGDSAPGDASVADGMIGQTLMGKYEVTQRIGKGGMGAVYDATQTNIGKRVAIKVLLDKYQERDQVVARLQQEARLAASIGHEHIIDIADFGQTDDGRTFVVMEYLEGESLGQCLGRAGPMDPSRVVQIGRQIASALGAAHAKGIVHRDVKPDNVFLLQRRGKDFVKVVDFGISKTMSPGEEGNSPKLTQTGMVLGTPLYMSPEQASGEDELDHRIDVYALGVMLYEMVTGEVPFKGHNYLNVISQVVSEEPIPPSERSEISDELEAVILKAMDKERDERYQNMAELDADLLAIEENHPRISNLGITAARRRKRRNRSKLRAVWALAGVAVVVAGVVLTVTLLLGGDPEGENKAAAAPPRPPVTADAAPPPVVPDAAPAVIANIKVISNPPGATIFSKGGNLELGTSPVDYECDVADGKVQLIAEMDGYDFADITIDPKLYDGKTVTLRLKKAKGKEKRFKRKKPAKVQGTKKPKQKPKDETAGGDLQGNPYNKDRKK